MFLLNLCLSVFCPYAHLQPCRVSISSTLGKASVFLLKEKKKKKEVCSIVIQTLDLAVSPLCAFQNKSTALISVATHHLPHQTEVARQCYCVHFSFFLWGLFIQRRLKFHIPHGRFIKSTNKTTWWQPESFKQLPNSPRRLARGFPHQSLQLCDECKHDTYSCLRSIQHTSQFEHFILGRWHAFSLEYYRTS